MNQASGGMNAERYIKFLKKLAVELPRYAPNFKDPESVEIHSEIYEDTLSGFSLSEFHNAYKKLRISETAFPAPKKIWDVLVAAKVGKTRSERWQELLKMIDQYRSRSGHNTCDEIMGRTIELMGGLKQMADYWSEKDLPFRQKEFFEVYDEQKNAHFNGDFNGKQLPVVGDRLCVGVGSEPQLLLPSAPPPQTEEEAHKARKAQGKSCTFDIKSLGLGQKQEGDAKLEKPEVVKLKLIDRLYSIAIEQGKWDGGIPEITTLEDRLFNSVEQESFAYCLANNPHLSRKVMHNSQKGQFKDDPDTNLTFYFGLRDDPLHDRTQTYVTQADLYNQVMSRKNPEQQEIYRRQVADKGHGLQ